METLEYLLEQYQTKTKSKAEVISQLEAWLAQESITEADILHTLQSLLEKEKISPSLFDDIFNLLQSISGKTVVSSNSALTSPFLTESEDDRTQVSSTAVVDNNDKTRLANDDQTVVVSDPNATRIATETDSDATQLADDVTSGGFDSNQTMVNTSVSDASFQPSFESGTPKKVSTGSVIKDRFILKDVIGAGGMSVVYKALDLRKQEAKNKNPYVAIKVLGDIFKNHLQSLLVLERESQQIQKLAHPNIVTVYDFDRDGETIYMTMECLEGKSLDQLISQNKQGMAYEKAVPYVEGMCRGLAYAHSKNIIHSDFKPENVFFTKDKVVKILDFGIARAKQIPGSTESSDEFDAGSLGALTPPYASCEMFENLDPDARDDIYALGCVTYKLLSGVHPFDGLPANKARDKKLKPKRLNHLTKRQWRTLEASLAFERSDRIATVVDFLNGFLPRTRSPWFYATAAAVVLTISIAGYSWFTVSTQPEIPHIKLSEDQQIQIKDALETAEVYISMGYLASPPGDSALDQFEKVLSIDPTNLEAINGKKEIANKYLALAEEELKNKDYEQSLVLIKTGLLVEPDNENLKSLELKATELRNKL